MLTKVPSVMTQHLQMELQPRQGEWEVEGKGLTVGSVYGNKLGSPIFLRRRKNASF